MLWLTSTSSASVHAATTFSYSACRVGLNVDMQSKLAVGSSASSARPFSPAKCSFTGASGDAGDPGYKATARMCVEAALCTVKSRDLCAAGGVLTPASALGDVYVQRLNASGMQLTAETLDAASAGARPPLARGASYRPSEMKAI
mgnify:CR=1 FL=1